MKTKVLLAVIVLLLAACDPAAASPAPSPTVTLQAFGVGTLGPQPTATASPQRTATDTPTVTPYPTFDAASVVTSTPFPPAECPEPEPEFEFPKNFNWEDALFEEQTTLDFLNQGASIRQFQQAFEQSFYADSSYKRLTPSSFLEVLDLTNDGIPELVLKQFMTTLFIGCQAGRYQILLRFFDGGAIVAPDVVYVGDMNLNGVPDIVLAYPASSGWNTTFNILEWDGTNFVKVLKSDHGEGSYTTSRVARTLYWNGPYWIYKAEDYETWPEDFFSPNMEGAATIKIRDIDGNGTKELIVKDYGPAQYDTLLNFGPWRGKEVMFKWDGLHFLYSSLEMDPPEYRFQALQDADRFFLMGDYDRALAFYRDVVFDQDLEWWSEARRDYQRDTYFDIPDGEPTPIPPEPDPNEYPTLAAYARYRILLYYLVNGWDEDARVVYDALREKYPPGAVGHQYARIAIILWNTYQEGHDPVKACAQVVDYSREHTEEIVDSLNPWYYGQQSHDYIPEDICPIGFW